MKKKLSAYQAQKLGLAVIEGVERIKEEIEDLGGLENDVREAMCWLYITKLKNGREFNVGVIIRETEKDRKPREGFVNGL